VLRLAERPETTAARAGGYLDRAIPQIGSMIGRLVRVEDTAARSGPGVFPLALAATRQAAGAAPAGRAPAGHDQLEPGENAARALERAASRALQREAS